MNLRLFIAVPVPEAIKRELAEAQRLLKQAAPSLRLVPPEGIHLTLKFLGDTPEEQVPEIAAIIDRVAATIEEPLQLTCRETGVFPNPANPRVVWAGLHGDLEVLGRLARQLDRELTKLGFPGEKRGFSPHLTLARVKFTRGLRDLEKARAAIEGRVFGSFHAANMVLYRSELQPAGAVYTALAVASLPQ